MPCASDRVAIKDESTDDGKKNSPENSAASVAAKNEAQFVKIAEKSGSLCFFFLLLLHSREIAQKREKRFPGDVFSSFASRKKCNDDACVCVCAFAMSGCALPADGCTSLAISTARLPPSLMLLLLYILLLLSTELLLQQVPQKSKLHRLKT